MSVADGLFLGAAIVCAVDAIINRSLLAAGLCVLSTAWFFH